MITIFNPEEQKWPIKVWLENEEQMGEECLQQAMNLANLPFLHQWVVLMPDTHSGYGMPIGGVIAAEKVIIPNAVGVDIGCGMSFVQTNVPVERLIEIETPNGNWPRQSQATSCGISRPASSTIRKNSNANRSLASSMG